MPTLELTDVHLTYDSATPVTALAGVTLTITPGEFVVIDGPSGGGKSTLLNVLGLLDAPTAGTYTIDGAPACATGSQGARTRSESFAFIFQNFHLLPRRPVLDSVELALVHRGAPRAERRARALSALVAVCLADRAAQPAHTLSGGQQQRVAIARALASGAHVVLADEPTGNLDTANSAAVMDTLRSVHALGVTVVLVTHDAQIAAAADRHLTIVDGLVVRDVLGNEPPRPPAPETAPGRPSFVRAGDLARDVLASVLSRPGRTAGLALAVAAAVGLSLATAGLTTSAAAQVSAAFDLRQNRYVTITDGPPTDVGQAHVVGWQHPDDQARTDALRHLAGVDAAAIVIESGQHELVTVSGRPAESLTVYVATADYADATHTTITWSDPNITTLGSGSILIGTQLAQRLDLGPVHASLVVLIDGRSVSVAGLITASEREPAWTSAIIAPISDRASYGYPAQTQALLLTATGAAQQVAAQAPLVMDPVDTAALTVVAPTDPRDLRATIERDVQTAMAVLTAVAVLAAVLALTNAMVLAVNERRAEIALRRALGARTAHIVALIVGEACTTGAIGGLLGTVVGTLAVLSVSIARHWAPVVDPRVAPWAMLGGVLIGAAGGLIAAVAAARVHPGRALRE